MLLGPIFRVEMVSTARRKRYFALRIVYAALILLVLWVSYESTQSWVQYGNVTTSIQQGTRLAAHFFYSFSWLQMLTILIIGPALAVGTIAEERERRTIEYLFATDLANHEIVLGKTIARLILLGKLVLVGLPILFLFRLMGGIPAQLLLATFLLAGSSALMITALSLCVSVWSNRARDATVRVYLLLAALFFLPMILKVFSSVGLGSYPLWHVIADPAIDACLVINPMWALGKSMDNFSAIGSRLDMSLLLTSVAWQLVVLVGALLWATAAVRRVHLGEATRGQVKSKRSWNYRFPSWRPTLGARPMIWKEMFAGTAKTRLGFVGYVALATILLAVLGTTVFVFGMSWEQRRAGRPNEFISYLAGLTGFLGSCMLLLLAARAAGLVSAEKERDCWMSLLATPLSGREIMTGKMWGNLYSVRWPLLVLTGAWALGVFVEPGFIIAVLAMAGTFLLLAWYVTNLGLFFSLRSPTTLRAMGATLGTLIFTAGGYLFCCCTVMAGTGGPNSVMLIIFAPCIPFLLGFPGIAYYEILTGSFVSHEGAIPAAYVLGNVLYLIVAGLLYAFMTNNFDRLAGRCGEASEKG